MKTCIIKIKKIKVVRVCTYNRKRILNDINEMKY